MAFNPLGRIHALQRPRSTTNLDPDELDSWENDDGYSVPPNVRDAGDGMEDDEPMELPAIGSPDRQGDPLLGMRAAFQKKAAYDASRPRESDYKPKGWQRALAGVAAGAAGYVNAGGRVKIDPRAVQNITGSLMRPGYSGAMQEWQDEGIPIAAEMEATGNEYKIGEAQRAAKDRQDRTAAYTKAQGASESLSRAREKKAGEDPWRISPTGHRMYKGGSGEFKDIEPPKPPPPMKETPQEKTVRLAKEAEEVLGYKKGTDEWLAHVGDKAAMERIRAKNRPPKVGKKSSDKPRVGTIGQFGGVQNKKYKDLSDAEAAHIKRFKTSTNPMSEAESLAILEADKRRIMDGYDAGVETLGGEVLPRGGKPVGPPPPVPPSKMPPGARTATNPKTGAKAWFDEATKQWVPL